MGLKVQRLGSECSITSQTVCSNYQASLFKEIDILAQIDCRDMIDSQLDQD